MIQLRPRSYFKVTENAVETNLPLLLSILPLECCVVDRPQKSYLDKLGEPVIPTTASSHSANVDHCQVARFVHVIGPQRD